MNCYIANFVSSFSVIVLAAAGELNCGHVSYGSRHLDGHKFEHVFETPKGIKSVYFKMGFTLRNVGNGFMTGVFLGEKENWDLVY
jgi:hypothetical protein